VPEAWPINGDIRVLYSLWLIPQRLKCDQVVHAYGFGVTTWVCWQGLRAAIRHRGGDATPTPLGSPRRGTFGLMVLAATAGMGFGALNEVVEFAATLLVPETNVGGYLIPAGIWSRTRPAARWPRSSSGCAARVPLSPGRQRPRCVV